MATALTKEGKHGTLYRFAVRYEDSCDRLNTGTSHYWAYDANHALELFYNNPDDGWRPTAYARLTDAPAHRQTWHTVEGG